MKYKGNVIWTVFRTVIFWVTGFMNTVFIKPQDAGTWKNYIGYVLLFLALIDTVFLAKRLFSRAGNKTNRKTQ